MLLFVLLNTLAEYVLFALGDTGAVVVLAAAFVVGMGGAFVTHGVPAIRTAQRTHLAADEGGVRCRWRGLRIYWPYGMVGKASLKHGCLSLIDADDIQLMSSRLYGAAPTFEARQLAMALEERTAHATTTLADAFESLQRRGRSLSEWLEVLDQEAPRAKGAQDFRAQHRDVDELVQTFEDRLARPEDRAAAAFALLATGSPDLAAQVRAGLNEASPPIVLALCQLAPSGREMVSQSWVEQAASYLDEDDRKERTTLLVRRGSTETGSETG
jgi:hypothetical protein